MLHECANPACRKPFRKLSDGRLFAVETDSMNGAKARKEDRHGRRIEHFWLCSDCAATLTLTYVRGRGIVSVPLVRTATKSALQPNEARNTEGTHES